MAALKPREVISILQKLGLSAKGKLVAM